MKFLEQCIYDLLRVFAFVIRNYRILVLSLIPLLVVEQAIYIIINEFISPLIDYHYYGVYNFAVRVIKFLIFAFIKLCALYLAEAAAFEIKTDLKEVIQRAKIIFKPFVLAVLAQYFIIAIGTILLVIPGLVASVFLSIFPIVFIFKKMEMKQAMIYSFKNSKPLFFRILVASLLLEISFLLISLAGPDFGSSVLHYFFNSLESIGGIIYIVFIYLYYLEIEESNKLVETV